MKMCRDLAHDARERTDAEIPMIGDREVMFATLLRGEAHVAAGLARERVSVAA